MDSVQKAGWLFGIFFKTAVEGREEQVDERGAVHHNEVQETKTKDTERMDLLGFLRNTWNSLLG